MESKFLVKSANLTGIVNYLNKNFEKKNGKFSSSDVLGYIKRGYLPIYIGGNEIREISQENCSVKLYDILK